MSNGFYIRGLWSCPNCGYMNIPHGRGPPYICDECVHQLDLEEDQQEVDQEIKEDDDRE